jgi:hypothetical protein
LKFRVAELDVRVACVGEGLGSGFAGVRAECEAAKQNLLPVMFGSFVDVFGGCSARIRRLGKKIGCWKV